jgi:hypothetical protein
MAAADRRLARLALMKIDRQREGREAVERMGLSRWLKPRT